MIQVAFFFVKGLALGAWRMFFPPSSRCIGCFRVRKIVKNGMCADCNAPSVF